MKLFSFTLLVVVVFLVVATTTSASPHLRFHPKHQHFLKHHENIVKNSFLNASDPSSFTFSPLTLRGLNYIFDQTYMTWDPENETASWQGWYKTANRDGNSALRYTIAHFGYTAAVSAKVYLERAASNNTKTKSDDLKLSSGVRSMAILSLRGAIERMIDTRVWSYIEEFEEFIQQPTFPDPVIYKNIMYSGHLAQLIALYENLSGDLQTYSEDGWDFLWNATTAPIHYNTSKLILAIWNQMGVYPSGGVPCEPDSIFVICNAFSNNAFVLFDKTHSTSFHTAQNKSLNWFESVKQNAIIGNPKLPPKIVDVVTKQYFALDYLLFPGIWEPLASEGSDAWALSFQAGWWPREELQLLVDGYISLRDSAQWVINETTQQALIVQEKKNPIGKMIFPFPDDITTSFFPMIWQQFGSGNVTDYQGRKLAQYSLNYFVTNFLEEHLPQCRICARYTSSENYRDWVTANVVAAQVLNDGGLDGSTLRNMFQEGF